MATSGTESAFRVWLVSLLINKCYFCVNMIWLFMTTRKPLKLTLHHPIPGDPGRSMALRSNKNAGMKTKTILIKIPNGQEEKT